MQKAVIMISSNQQVSDAVNEIVKLEEQAKQQFVFLKKQAEDVREKTGKAMQPHFQAIAEQIKEKLPEDFSLEKYHFHSDRDEDLIYLCDGDHNANPLEALIKRFGGIAIGPL